MSDSLFYGGAIQAFPLGTEFVNGEWQRAKQMGAGLSVDAEGVLRIADGGYEARPSIPAPPLDASDPATFDKWVVCGDGRTIWEFANGMRV